jgi:hypothetical protein
MTNKLKEEINNNAMLLYNVLVDFRNVNQCHFPSGFIAHTNSDVILVVDVLILLDNVAKQIQEKLEFYREQFEQAEGFFSTPYGAKIEALEWVLTILTDNEEKQEAKPNAKEK